MNQPLPRASDAVPLALTGAGLLGLAATAILALLIVTDVSAPPPPPPPSTPVLGPLRPAPDDVCATADVPIGEQLELERRRVREAEARARRRRAARELDYEGGAPFGCSTMSVIEGGSRRGRIQAGGIVHRDDLLRAKILDNGNIVGQGELLGRVDTRGRVFRGRNLELGRVGPRGDVWVGGTWVGQLRDDGQLIYRGMRWGRVEGYTASPLDRRAMAVYLLMFATSFR